MYLVEKEKFNNKKKLQMKKTVFYIFAGFDSKYLDNPFGFFAFSTLSITSPIFEKFRNKSSGSLKKKKFKQNHTQLFKTYI
jgi:hypothetical protein